MDNTEAQMGSLIGKYTEACVEFLRELIRIPSVNGEQNEGTLAQAIQTHAESLGLLFKLYEAESGRPNVYVGEPSQFSQDSDLLFVAHEDTVPVGDESKWQYLPFGGEVHDGKVYGRGAVDCKGGIALGIYALKILNELGAKERAKLLVGADEESGADSRIGIRHVLEQGLRARGAIYLYGGRRNNTLIIGHRGVLRVWVVCHGEQAHSGSREWQDGAKGASAIDGILQFIHRVREYTRKIKVADSEHFKGYQCVITPTLLEGGSGESLVPDKARVLLDVRTLPDQSNEDIIANLQKIADELTKEKLRYELDVKNNVPVALSDPADEFITSAQAVVKKVYGYEDVSLKGSGPANESHMLIAKGIPTVVGFGPIGDGFHSWNEYAEMSSIEQSLQFLVSLALKDHGKENS